MIDRIKNYIIFTGSLIIAALFSMLKLKDKKLEASQNENSVLKNEKALGDITNEAKNSREEYNRAVADYNDFKLRNPGLFKKK